MFICEGLAASAPEVGSGVAPSMPDSSIPSSQAFSLSSRPTAAKKIYLDFDGHITQGSDWNSAFSRPTITSPAYGEQQMPRGERECVSPGRLAVRLVHLAWLRIKSQVSQRHQQLWRLV